MNKRGIVYQLPIYNNATDYMNDLLADKLPQILWSIQPIETGILKSFGNLANKKYEVLYRTHEVRKIIGYFNYTYLNSPAELHFPVYLKENAYMTDLGELAISLMFLYSSSGIRIIKVLIHELAHLILSNLVNYDRLLLLDNTYRTQHEYMSLPALLSPIEMFASRLECEILLRLAEQFKSKTGTILKELGMQETKRINTVIDSLRL